MNKGWLKYLPIFLQNQLGGRTHIQAAISNTSWMMGDYVTRKIVHLLVGLLMARYFGPQLYGEFSYSIAVVMILSPVAILALDSISIKRLAKDPSCRDGVLGTSFILMLVGGSLTFLLSVGTIFLVRPNDQLVQWLVGILSAGCIFQAFIAIEFWFESQMQWKFTVYAKTTSLLLVSFIKIGLLLLHMPLIAFAWAALGEVILSSIGLVLVYRSQGFSVFHWKFSKSMASSMLSDGWPLILSAMVTMIYLRIDQVMIGNMVGSKELGEYSVAVQLSEVWYFIPLVITSSVLPAFVDVETHSEELFYAHLQRLYRILALYSYLIALPISIFATDLVVLLFSEAYASAGPLVSVMVWAGIFTNLGAARNILILVKNWTRVNLISIIFGGVVNVLLNLLLIPAYGTMGAVVGTLISYWFAIHGSCFLLKPLRETGWMMTKAMLYPKVW